jgi:shikimate kinase
MAAKPTPILVLIGLRGAGKSTVGRLLADRCGGGLVDLDERTAKAMGETSPGEALSRHGESAFRRAELDALTVAMREPIAVLSLGGGTPTAQGAATALMNAQHAGRIRIVYLRALPNSLRERLASSGEALRPSLTGRGTLAEVDELFEQRDPLYRRLAAVTIDVDALEPESVVERICTV